MRKGFTDDPQLHKRSVDVSGASYDPPIALDLIPTEYGRPASEALRAAVARAKAGDALAPVTVVVPTNSVGVSARRRLASGELGPVSATGRGVVAVTFVTVRRIAELIAAPTLAQAGRRPLATPVIASAVRRVLARSPGWFRPVAEHPATEEALVAAYQELADLDDAQLDVLGAQPRAREVVRVHRAARARLATDWYDEHDLLRVAAELVGEGNGLVEQLGQIVCFLPQRWTGSEARLLTALARRTDVHVIAGQTGVARADAPVRASLERIGLKLAEIEAVVPASATAVVTTSDPDDEVRMVVRGIVEATRHGVPLERMAVLYGANEPYARLVHEHLDLAGIPHNGASVTTLVDSVLGRSLLRLFALADGGFARDDIGAFLTAAPVLDADGKPASTVEWERMSREAGVVRGLGEWRTRLDAFAMKLGPDEWNARKQEHVGALRAFIELLANELETGSSLQTWADLGAWALRGIARFFGRESRRTRWSLFEQEAARRVEATIDRLATLDSVDDHANLAAFRRTLELELAAARVRVGRLGEGVLAGPVSFALGVDLDRTWILGLAEGVFPGVHHDDPLLADRDRAVLDGALRLRSERVDDDHRMFLAALASTTGDRVCSYPRGDLRRSTEHVPSRFLVPTIEAIGTEAVATIASYAQGLAQAEFPATEHELAVRAALGDAAWVRDLAAVAQGTELVAARSSSSFTRFDGHLGHLGDRLARVSPAAGNRAISPTRLETWANCPHAYFMQSWLGIEPIERPESILQLSPLDRGTIMHEVLDRFLTIARERENAGAPWTPADHDELHAIALEVFRDAEASGITGRPLLWRRDQRLILAELDAFLAADEQYRAEFGARTLATELGFGVTGAEHPAVEVALADGRVLRMRGKADRIDQRADGALVVIDYKTGRPDGYRNINGDDPVPGGRFLQLPIYAYAARAAYGDATVPVSAWYWFVGRGNNQRRGYDVDPYVDGEFQATVGAIVDGIEAGVFPPNPPEPGPRFYVQCHYCDPDGLGTNDVFRSATRKWNAPELAGYLELVGTGVEAEAEA